MFNVPGLGFRVQGLGFRLDFMIWLGHTKDGSSAGLHAFWVIPLLLTTLILKTPTLYC